MRRSPPEQRERRQSKLTDDDHRVHAVFLLGGVTIKADIVRGTPRTGWFTADGEEVTKQMLRLYDAGLVPKAKHLALDAAHRAHAEQVRRQLSQLSNETIDRIVQSANLIKGPKT